MLKALAALYPSALRMDLGFGKEGSFALDAAVGSSSHLIYNFSDIIALSQSLASLQVTAFMSMPKCCWLLQGTAEQSANVSPAQWSDDSVHASREVIRSAGNNMQGTATGMWRGCYRMCLLVCRCSIYSMRLCTVLTSTGCSLQ